MATTSLTVALTLVHASPQATVGSLYTETIDGTGERTWIYIKNASVTATAVGTIMSKAAGVATYATCTIAAISADPMKVVGVAQHVIAAGSYGWILRRGAGFVLADATGYAADVGLMLDASTAGCAMAVADTDDVRFGTSYIAQSGAGATGKAILNCIG